MLKSMTGFGKSEFSAGNKNFQAEIRSLNSKSLDINLKIPQTYREKESVIRNLLSTGLLRGKVDFVLTPEQTGIKDTGIVNRDTVKTYFNEFKNLAEELNIKNPDESQFLISALRMPDATTTSSEKTDENEWLRIEAGIREAIDKLNEFRTQEGKMIESDLKGRIHIIMQLIAQVEPFEKNRVEKFREKIQKQLAENLQNQDYDKNRLEQELIYYIEKLDITEEKVRLKNHCNYFIEMFDETEAPGKKLGFIAQEIGREINTLGSKANDSGIQKIVVQMKDELEKVKEQLMNVL